MGLIPNPWVLLAFMIALVFTGVTAFEKGDTEGRSAVQAAWTKSDLTAQIARAARILSNQQTGQQLQQDADKQRQADHDKITDLNTRLIASNNELRKRNARPADNGASAGVQPASTGPQGGGCTGAGLYSDDSVFLNGKADLFQRIRLQRDSCYAAYERAQAAVAKLQCQ